MKQNKFFGAVLWGIFIGYVVMVAVTLFGRGNMEYRNVNLIPFKSIAQGIGYHDGIRYHLVDMQAWGNVLIFAPMGLYIMILSKRASVPLGLLKLALLSLGAEVIQYVFKMGASDIDDIILNVLGGLLGVLAYLLLEKIFKTKEKVRSAIAALSLCVGGPVILLALVLIFVNYVR